MDETKATDEQQVGGGVSLEALWDRYVDESNWRENEQGFPHIEIGGRVVVVYPWDTDGWAWMIYRGEPQPLAWMADADRLYADGAYACESDARFDAWEALVAPVDESAARTRDGRRAAFRIERAVRRCGDALSGLSFAEMKRVMHAATDETQWF